MSSQGMQVATEDALPRKKVLTSETIFKYVNICVTLILLFCVKGYLNFRNFAFQKNLYVFSVDSFVWSLIGFIGIFAMKYSWSYFMRNRMEKMVHSRYEGEERVRKLRSVLKLSNDSIFYTTMTVLGYVLFRNEYWFPGIVGGAGECSQIYRDYPNWPAEGRFRIELYYMIQLGIHFFSLFEIIIIKRKTQLKFHEYCLHHSIAVSLIMFSIMSNQVTDGVVVLIIHDASDILMAFARFYIELDCAKKWVSNLTYIFMILIWVWMRVVVFPFCCLTNLYLNRPTENDSWMMIWFEYNYILVMAIVLYGMHLFWTFLIIKIGLKSIGKKSWDNVHDKKIKH